MSNNSLALIGERFEAFMFPYEKPREFIEDGSIFYISRPDIIHVLEFAEDDVERFPRNHLEGISVPKRIFVYQHLFHLLNGLPEIEKGTTVAQLDPNGVYEYMRTDFNGAGFTKKIKTQAIRAMTEHSAWLLAVVGDIQASNDFDEAATTHGNAEIMEMKNNYVSLFTYPELNSYFTVGIWDIDFILDCVANDIEPELAFEMIAL